MRLQQWMSTAICAALIWAAVLSCSTLAHASTGSRMAAVSITIDDGFESVTDAAKILQSRGLTGTAYIVTGWVGTPSFIKTWDDVRALRDTYKMEVGSHTRTHPLLTTVSATQLEQELLLSKTDLANQGITATTFAYPYGDYDDGVVRRTAKYYSAARGFFDTDEPNVWPFSQLVLHEQQVQGDVSVAQVKAWVDAAIANHEWLILVFHKVLPVASTVKEDYEFSAANFTAVCDYIRSTGIRCCTVADGLAADTPNLLPDSGFWTGTGGAWRNDDPTNIVSNMQGFGAMPTPSSSISLKNATSSKKNTHLLSPVVPVAFGTTYGVKAFLDLQKIAKGEFGLYIDEYNSSGGWVGGKYMGGVTQASVGEISLTYTPSGANVAGASLQVILQSGAGITAWLDSPRWVPAQ